MKSKTQLFLVLYSLFILIMGFYGYQQTGSLASLITGLLFGLLLLGVSYYFRQNKPWAPWVGVGLTFLLFVTFIYRFNKTMSFTSIFMAILSGVMLYFLIWYLLQKTRKIR